MTVTTMTFRHASTFDAIAWRAERALASGARAVAGLFQTTPRSQPRTAQELLAWAEQYEATQPSYAADLRSAALNHLRGRAD
ncbi:MAG: hypothetical protein RIQ60_3647 [Pseudomonadota bacterium]|jgi:hypothetical protein